MPIKIIKTKPAEIEAQTDNVNQKDYETQKNSVLTEPWYPLDEEFCGICFERKKCQMTNVGCLRRLTLEKINLLALKRDIEIILRNKKCNCIKGYECPKCNIIRRLANLQDQSSIEQEAREVSRS